MSPFNGLNMLQKSKLFNLLEVHIYKYKKNQEILPTLGRENVFGIILQGSADIIKIDYDGNETIMEKLPKEGIFNTYMNIINSEENEIISREDDTEVLIINYNILLRHDNSKHVYYNIFMNNLFNIINDNFKKMNEKIRILEKKTIRDKLLEFFEIEYKKTYLKTIELPFNLKDLADYIAVNRSAMFRELKNLKEEKFISVKGKRITLLYKANNFI